MTRNQKIGTGIAIVLALGIGGYIYWRMRKTGDAGGGSEESGGGGGGGGGIGEGRVGADVAPVNSHPTSTNINLSSVRKATTSQVGQTRGTSTPRIFASRPGVTATTTVGARSGTLGGSERKTTWAAPRITTAPRTEATMRTA